MITLHISKDQVFVEKRIPRIKATAERNG